MGKGRRYNGEQKLNMKKVAAVVVVILLIILFIVGIMHILNADKNATLSKKNIELNYLALYTNGNWGVINSYGEVVIEAANSEMIEIPNKTKGVFICTYDVNDVDGTYKTKVINDKNQEIFTEFENVSALQNYDENNKLWYEQNVLKAQKDGKTGLINYDGAVVLPCEYDSITTMKGVKNTLLVKKENQVGVADSTGKIVIPIEHQDIVAITNNYENGFIVKDEKGKFGVVKANGDMALECKYDAIKNIIDGNRYVVNEAGNWKVIAEDGTAYLEGKVANAVDMNNGDVIINNNGKFGISNINTDVKIAPEYDALTYMFDDKYIAKKDEKFGVISADNQVITEFKYQNILYNNKLEYVKAENTDGTFDYMTKDLTVRLTAGNESIVNGFICIKNGNDVKYYNNKLEEKNNKDVYTSNTLFINKENGKYGFKNKEGKVVVEAKYDDATEQNDYGYVSVKKDGKWGTIDQEGKVVVEPKYNLDNNNSVEFVGKWHICADSNANYYTDAE